MRAGRGMSPANSYLLEAGKAAKTVAWTSLSLALFMIPEQCTMAKGEGYLLGQSA